MRRAGQGSSSSGRTVTGNQGPGERPSSCNFRRVSSFLPRLELDRPSLELREPCDDDCATEGWRRARDDRHPLECALKGRTLDHPIGGDLVREQWHEIAHGGRPGITQVLEAGHHDGGLGTSARAVDASPFGSAFEDRHEDLEEEALRLAQLDPFSRQRDRGLEQLRPRQPAMPRMRFGQPSDEPRDGYGALTEMEHLGRCITEVDHHLVHLATCP